MLGKSTGSLLCGFAFAFDLAAKSFTISCDACSSGRSSGTSVLLWFESITNLFDPWEILTQDWELSSLRDQILTSIPCLPYRQLVVISNTGPILVCPWIHLVVMIRHFLEECIHDKSSQRIVLQCLLSWNTVQLQQHVWILHPYRIYSLCFLVKAIWFVLHIVAMEDSGVTGCHSPKELLLWFQWEQLIVLWKHQVAPIDLDELQILHTCLQLLRKDWADWQ